MHLPDDLPKFDLHPDRLRALAHLFHLPLPNPVEQARITILGVHHGANVLALATEYPKAKITAVVVDSTYMPTLKAAITHLQLKNVQVMPEKKWLEYTPKIPADYILCHAYFSYLTDDAKDQFVAKIGAVLHPQGLAYINYLIQPGWQAFANLQYLLEQTCAQYDVNALTEESLNQGINLIYNQLPENSVLRQSIKHIVPNMNLRTHPNLHGYWVLHPAHAETTQVFFDRIHHHQLGYVCDSDVARYYFNTLPSDVNEYCGVNFHLRENLYDLVYEQSSRASIITPVDQLLGFRMPQREAMIERLDTLHISGSFELTENQTVWVSQFNRNISISASAFNSMLLQSLNSVYAAHSTLSVSKLLETITTKFQQLPDIAEYASSLILDLILSGSVHVRTQRQNGFKHQEAMLDLHKWRLEHNPYLTPANKWLQALDETTIAAMQQTHANAQ